MMWWHLGNISSVLPPHELMGLWPFLVWTLSGISQVLTSHSISPMQRPLREVQIWVLMKNVMVFLWSYTDHSQSETTKRWNQWILFCYNAMLCWRASWWFMLMHHPPKHCCRPGRPSHVSSDLIMLVPLDDVLCRDIICKGKTQRSL